MVREFERHALTEAYSLIVVFHLQWPDAHL
jgi:hypothetical protein